MLRGKKGKFFKKMKKWGEHKKKEVPGNLSMEESVWTVRVI